MIDGIGNKIVLIGPSILNPQQSWGEQSSSSVAQSTKKIATYVTMTKVRSQCQSNREVVSKWTIKVYHTRSGIALTT